MPLLPDPAPRPRRFPVISVDDHLIEPPDLFEGRMPAHARRPRAAHGRVRERQAGVGLRGPPLPQHRAQRGRRPSAERVEHGAGALRRDAQGLLRHPRPHRRHGPRRHLGAASASRRSSPGSPGVAFAKSDDQELGLACVRAWNDWHLEVWAGTYPERMIPLQLAWLRDPEIAADDVRRNAERGFKAVTFPESTTNLGLPSMHTDHWDPLLRACEETGTVVCLHTGRRDRAADVAGLAARADHHAVPDPRAARRGRLAVGRHPAALPRAERRVLRGRHRLGADAPRPARLRDGALGVGHGQRLGRRHRLSGATSAPSEAVRRNFWFCSIDDPTTLRVRDRIGVDHIMVESDYPHADSSWPDTQALLADAPRRPPRRRRRQAHPRERRPPVPPPPPAAELDGRRRLRRSGDAGWLGPGAGLHLCDRPLLCSPADRPNGGQGT